MIDQEPPLLLLGADKKSGENMTSDTVRLYAKYNAHANNEMNVIISNLTPDEWTKELGGFFPNVYKLCHHLYSSDLVWLKRFAGFHQYKSLNGEIFFQEISWTNIYFHNPEEYLAKRKQLDDAIIEFSLEIKDEELDESIEYKSMKGESQKRNFGGILLHFFNHQTHHRGMVSIYLELLGKANDFSNLAFLV
jgi:uncharacterized damage-inducible protein DinB